ncbi:MAG: hypothetical protein IMF00_02595 [Proteobacteria bacterium]|nr:hypothetical protein [Pseudomonadota bacterium]
MNCREGFYKLKTGEKSVFPDGLLAIGGSFRQGGSDRNTRPSMLPAA